MVGNRGTVEINARDLMMCEGSIVGVLRGSDHEMKSATLACERLLQAGAVKPVVGHEFRLEDAAEAHREVLAHTKGTNGKIVISIH